LAILLLHAGARQTCWLAVRPTLDAPTAAG
jgi:hypothetical protein